MLVGGGGGDWGGGGGIKLNWFGESKGRGNPR